MDFSCASCHGEDGKRIRLQDLPNLTKNPGDGIGFAAWPAYRVSSGELWSMQRRLNDCYRQQRFPYPGYASDVTIALGVYMGVNAKGAEAIGASICSSHMALLSGNAWASTIGSPRPSSWPAALARPRAPSSTSWSRRRRSAASRSTAARAPRRA